ncbi:hypothetical protein A5658_23705 [Mycobacterium sp. 1245111.1]|uniref:tetratricopeptide repeat protein n=1 Tax=Mycobacterium sp. 1245111.1 TaxID=1834073 RepID=UPI0008009F23|nr:tetratricopeptide repeat protein [Mycobacterium sp. 1245111.1]OBK39776.1 hypothetical protein A5658_23705 [Mycobacterium sp. 1245111.1]
MPDDEERSGAAPSPSALYEAATTSATAGDFTDALRYGTQSLTAYTEAFGDRHPDTLAVAALIPSWRLGTGDVSGALSAAREIVPAATEVLGVDHPGTVAARHVLACCDAEFNLNPAEALPVWVALYADEQRVFGADDHSTLGARHQIGELRRQLGDRIGARDELVATALAMRQTLGDHHPDSLAVQLAAAICVGEAGDMASAVSEFDRLIPALSAVMGHDHQHTFLARHTRALWLPSSYGWILDRVSDWEVLVDDEVRVLGEQHHLTVAGRQTLAEQRLDWEEALDTQDDVSHELLIEFEMEDRDLEFDPERPWGDPGSLDEDGKDNVAEQTADLRAALEGSMNAVVDAKKALWQAIREAGTASRTYLSRRYELAHALWRGHEFDSARAWVEPLITECSSLLGDDDPLTHAAHSLLTAILERRWV